MSFFSACVNSASITVPPTSRKFCKRSAVNHPVSHIRRVWKRCSLTKHREIENLTRWNRRQWINSTRWTLPLNRNESHIHYSYSSLNTAINSRYLSSPPLKFKAAIIFAAGMRSNGPLAISTHTHTHTHIYYSPIYTLPSSVSSIFLNQRVSPKTPAHKGNQANKSLLEISGRDRFDSTAFSYLCPGRQKRVRTPEAWPRFHCLMHRWIHSCPASIRLRERENAACGLVSFSSFSSSFLLFPPRR